MPTALTTSSITPRPPTNCKKHRHTFSATGSASRRASTVAPVAVTHAPEEENLSALYNIEELIYQQQLEQVKAQGGDERDLMTEEQKLQSQEIEREEILNTTVYAVFSHAQRYHAERVCGTQSNNRELTVRQAMLEALSPCPDCNPPVWTE